MWIQQSSRQGCVVLALAGRLDVAAVPGAAGHLQAAGRAATSEGVAAPPQPVAVDERRPRAVDAGQRGLGQPARHNASAATVQPEAAQMDLACDQPSKPVACRPRYRAGWWVQ